MNEYSIGKFSASECWKLMENGRRPMTDEELAEEKRNGGKRKTIDDDFSKIGMTYIYEKVAEFLTGQSHVPEFTSASTDWGKKHEDEARDYFKAATGILVEKIKNPFENEYLIGVPDGLGFEIKCPYNSGVHMKNLGLSRIEDLKVLHVDYFWQIVGYAYLTGIRKWKFCSYDPRFKSPENRMIILNIEIVDEMINYLEIKLKKAKKIYENIRHLNT